MTKLDLSIINMIKEYRRNEDVIRSYIAYKRGKDIEGFMGIDFSAITIMGMGIGFFLIIFACILGLYIWSIWALIKFKHELPTWAIVLSILSLFLPTGPVGTLFIVYFTKGQQKLSFNFRGKSKAYVF
jgi:hypothetical protein